MRINNKSVAVIGYGSWATALVYVLVKNRIEVWWHVKNDDIRKSLLNEGRNTKYLSDVELDTLLINVSDDINDVISNSDLVLIAAPSAFLKSLLDDIRIDISNKFFLSATKGFVEQEYTVTEYIKLRYDISYDQLGVISGPSHAEEVSRNKLSYLTVACKNKKNAILIREMFRNENLKIEYSQDIYGIEYAAILKNIYALALGLASGLGYGDNFRAVLASACARELTLFINESFPFDRDTMRSAYLGDLLVTAYSNYSRNRRLGQLIGHGCTVKSALNEMTMIAEGYYAAAGINILNKNYGIKMPIAEMVYDILYNRANPRKKMQELGELL